MAGTFGRSPDEEPGIAAVQPKILAYTNRNHFEYAGACGGFIDSLGFPFCRGRILNVTEEDRGQYDEVREVFWCSGAALCIRRESYLQAGGLDERFFAHMEEIDLCWRIRNRGYALKVQPASVVYHLGGGSLPMNHPRKLFLNYRNNLLMLYKNLSPREWKSKSRKRRVLDFMAWVMFLVKGGVGQCTIGGPGLPGIRKNEKKGIFLPLLSRSRILVFIRDLLFLLFISGMFVLFSQLWK